MTNPTFMTGILTLTFKRLLARPIMSFAILIGLSIAVGLTMSVPMYADAVNFRLLEARLAKSLH